MTTKVKVGKTKVNKGRRGLGGANWGIVGDALNATLGNMARLGRLIEDTNPKNKKKNKEMDAKMKKKGQYNLTGGRRKMETKPIKNKKK